MFGSGPSHEFAGRDDLEGGVIEILHGFSGGECQSARTWDDSSARPALNESEHLFLHDPHEGAVLL